MAATHLTQQERYQIEALLHTQNLQSAEVIAKILGRSPTTIRAEIRRGRTDSSIAYCAASAQAAAKKRKANNAKRFSEATWGTITTLLAEKWSPEQIAEREMIPALDFEISHMSIYRWVRADKAAGGQMFKLLRHPKPYRKHLVTDSRGKIPNRRDISERPEIVEKRARIGDWELDLVMGGDHKGAIVSINERYTGISLQKWIPNKEADRVAAAVIQLLKPIKTFVYTITADNGLEFAKHEWIAESLQADFYFAKPYSPWQRGSNENTNGLIRQYFPKGIPLIDVKEYEVWHAMNQMNNRPRKRHGYRTPLEVFADKIGMSYSSAMASSIH